MDAMSIKKLSFEMYDNFFKLLSVQIDILTQIAQSGFIIFEKSRYYKFGTAINYLVFMNRVTECQHFYLIQCKSMTNQIGTFILINIIVC